MKRHETSTSFGRILARKMGKIMLISVSIITLCLIALSVILLIQSPGKMNRLLN